MQKFVSKLGSKFAFKIALGFFAGALLVTSFAPFEWALLAFFSLAILFVLAAKASPREAFYLGLAFGYGQFGVGVSWVYISLHVYGGMPLWMGSIAVLLFAGILAVFAALSCLSAARLFPAGGPQRIVALAFLWVIFEWLKSWIFTGFAWLEIGVSQTSTWFAGFAPIGGVYLVSLAVVLCAASMAILLSHRELIVRNRIAAVATLFIIIAAAFISDQINWSEGQGEPIRVGIVQANVPIDQKWQANFRDGVIAKLRGMSQALIKQEPTTPKVEQVETQGTIDLLVWPETALPLYYQQTNSEFWRSLIPDNTALLTGIVDSPAADETYNAAVLNCQGEQQIYRKRHLVPFGEYLPMRFLLNWLLEYLQLPMSDFSAWRAPQTLNCGEKLKIGLSICYEDAFANEHREYSGDANILVNISEDAWFGDSFAPHQRLQMGQMRARELARPMVRSANSGPSAVLDHRGNILVQTDQFTDAMLAQTIQPQTGETPYKRFGNWVVYLSMLVLVLLTISSRRRL